MSKRQFALTVVAYDGRRDELLRREVKLRSQLETTRTALTRATAEATRLARRHPSRQAGDA